VSAAVAATLLGGLPVWLVASVAPQLQEDLHLDAAGLGTAIGLNFLVLSLTAVPAGRLVERIGWRRGLALTAGLSAISLLGIAVGTRSWPVLVALLCVGAVAASLSHPSSNVGIAQRVPADRQGVAFGVKQAAVPLTTLVAGLASPLVAETVGWRWSFAGSGVLALAFVVSVSRRGRAASPVTAGPARAVESGDEPSVAGTPGPVRPPVDASLASLVVLAAGAGLVTAATLSLGSFLVLSAVDAGMSPRSAGFLLALGSGVGIASRVVTGFLADRRAAGHLLVVAWMMLGGSVGLLVLAAGDAPWVLLVGTLLAFGLGWSWNGLFALVIVLRNPGTPAFATGVIQTALAAGGIVGPPVFGLVVDHASYALAWAGAAGASTGGALLVLVGRRMMRAAIAQAS
jgi:MFS family permease